MSLINYAEDFSFDLRHIWLNVASEGPLPNKSKDALMEAITWKQNPHLLTIPKFQQIPYELKKTIAQLIHVKADEVILGNSATYGLHLLVHGLEFKPADEIILLQNDFPTDILPWLSLEKKGVIIRQLQAKHYVLSLEEIVKAVTPRTKLICLPFIHSFSGFKQDIAAIGKFCRSHGILCVVNLSQAAGAIPIDLSQWQIDAAVCAGYKWLLGPYGTGFCWIKNEVLEKLDYAQNYWISLMDESSLRNEGIITLKDDHSARRYDVFGTANFFNFVPWQASIAYLLSIGLDKIEQHNKVLVDQFIEGLSEQHYKLISPKLTNERSNIVVFSCNDESQNVRLFEFLNSKGLHLALWKNKLRVSPHLYNSQKQIEKLLEVLELYASQ